MPTVKVLPKDQPTTLKDYYASQGVEFQAWDSPSRQGSANMAGIQNYEGTQEQNDVLLKYLLNQNTAPVNQPVVPFPNQQVNTNPVTNPIANPYTQTYSQIQNNALANQGSTQNLDPTSAPVMPGSPGTTGSQGLVEPTEPTDTQPGATDAEGESLSKKLGAAGFDYDGARGVLSNKYSLDEAELNSIREELGIPETETALFKRPAKSTLQWYQDQYNTLRIGDIDRAIREQADNIAVVQQTYLENELEIRENPWLTEKAKTGRLGRAQDFRDGKLAVLEQRKSQYENARTNQLNVLQTQASLYDSDLRFDKELSEAKLNYLSKKAEQTAGQRVADRTNDNFDLDMYLKGLDESLQTDNGYQAVGSDYTGYYSFNKDTGEFSSGIPASRWQTASTKLEDEGVPAETLNELRSGIATCAGDNECLNAIREYFVADPNYKTISNTIDDFMSETYF